MYMCAVYIYIFSFICIFIHTYIYRFHVRLKRVTPVPKKCSYSERASLAPSLAHASWPTGSPSLVPTGRAMEFVNWIVTPYNWCTLAYNPLTNHSNQLHCPSGYPVGWLDPKPALGLAHARPSHVVSSGSASGSGAADAVFSTFAGSGSGAVLRGMDGFTVISLLVVIQKWCLNLLSKEYVSGFKT